MYTKSIFSRVGVPVLLAVSATMLSSCGRANPPVVSGLDTVDLPHTQSKWQSIGNCWIYAALGWVESLVLQESGGKEQRNFSETYLTYRYFEEQLRMDRSANLREINTGGFWGTAMNLIRKYGLMNEGDFIPVEADKTFSDVQKRAVDRINSSLKAGALKDDRTLATIRAELDKAFGVNLEEVKGKIISADDIIVAQDAETNESITLTQETGNWAEEFFPLEQRPSSSAGAPVGPLPLGYEAKNLLKKAMHAMNTGHPVLISWFVDFGALDSKGIFSLETLKKNGMAGQGYHMTVLEDYVVSGIDPRTNQPFHIGEGQATSEEMELAKNYGDIDYVVVKNSWGGAERPGRASYQRDNVMGFHRINADYLFGVLKQKDEETGKVVGVESALNGMILPKKLRKWAASHPVPKPNPDSALCETSLTLTTEEAETVEMPLPEKCTNVDFSMAISAKMKGKVTILVKGVNGRWRKQLDLPSAGSYQLDGAAGLYKVRFKPEQAGNYTKLAIRSSPR